MPSTFKSQPLFSSGPHRFCLDEQREILVPFLSQGGLVPGSIPVGIDELKVLVRGRLVASGEAALWTLRDALVAHIEHPPSPGTLVDRWGRSWSDMSLVRVTENDRTDRGRQWSLSYECEFRRVIM